MKRIYYISLNVPAGTGSPTNPYSTANNTISNYPPLVLPLGVIVGIMPIFPSGANELLFAQLVDASGNVIYPTESNQNGYINLTDTAELTVPITYPLTARNNTVNINAFNTDPNNAHLITFGIIMEIGGATQT